MEKEQILRKFDMLLEMRNLTPKTQKSYHQYADTYLSWCERFCLEPDNPDLETIYGYYKYLIDFKKYAARTINTNMSCIKTLLIYVFHMRLDRYMIPHLRVDTNVRVILSLSEVKIFINSLSNLKHKAIVSVMYSCALRASEVCSLRYEDVSREKKEVMIRSAKNRSARIVPVSEHAIDTLTEYWFKYGKPRGWLFPGQKPDTHISVATLRVIITDNCIKLGWKDKGITTHTFRHSAGTHLYENGCNLPTIQKFLGHRTLSSTLVYISNSALNDVRNPLDMAMEG